MSKQINTGITLVDVRTEAMDTIQRLKAGSMDVKTASEIRNLCNTVIDVAKTQVEFIKAIPNSVKEQMTATEVKAIAGTLTDRDAELDASMVQIKDSMNKPYESGK